MTRPEQDALQLAESDIKQALSDTWQLALQTVFSTAVQLVSQLVEQLVVAGDSRPRLGALPLTCGHAVGACEEAPQSLLEGALRISR